ncbi:hypothetical protein PABG_11646 [Paracoccidioides brasiliensis Pb03]|nr:hypothetical protein PABG_11646 [Paracoccidioides brasiliensis Pb03]
MDQKAGEKMKIEGTGCSASIFAMSKCLSLEPQRPLSHLGYTAKMKILAGVHCAATIWCSSFQGGRETFLDGILASRFRFWPLQASGIFPYLTLDQHRWRAGDDS